MSGGVDHNAGPVAGRLRSRGAAMRREVAGELQSLAEQVAARMRVLAPKFRSTLTNSIRAEKQGGFDWFVAPHVAYDLYVEKGRKPGKGLPRFSDPDAGPIVAWLEGRIGDQKRQFVGPLAKGARPWRKARRNSRAAVQENLELRDRYMALSRYVKFHGIKPSPFVKPTADEFRPRVPLALLAAVQRSLRPGSGT